MNTYGENKASDRKNIKALLTASGLIAFFAAVVGQRENPEVAAAVTGLGFEGFCGATTEVLRTQVSGHRGRPALEEKPVHTMLKAIREALKHRDSEDAVDTAKATKVLAKALKVAEREQAQLQARRTLFKPSKRIQGARRLPILAVAAPEEPKEPKAS